MNDPLSSAPGAPVISETRLENLLRHGKAAPRFLQGVFAFAGRGIFDIGPLDESLAYVVPTGKTAQVQYVRAGNLSEDLIYLVLFADERPTRYFPVGPRGDFHVSLAIVEGHPAGTRLDVRYAAPRGLAGTVVIDVGLVEMEERR